MNDGVEHEAYLPRLAGSEVLVHAIRDGVELLTWPSDTFAYAESYDEGSARYRGLRGGQAVTLSTESAGLLVKPDLARRQMDAETHAASPGRIPGGETGADGAAGVSVLAQPGATGAVPGAAAAPRPRRFHGTVQLDSARVGRDAGRIADEVIAHLSGLVGSSVKVTLEIDAEISSGVPENVVRTVTENSRTLKFDSYGFEQE